jgi:carboxyl-terminal processing protease
MIVLSPVSGRRSLGRVLAALCLAAVVLLGPTSAVELTEQKPSDRRVALLVTQLLRMRHLSQHAPDDEISERCLQTFLKSLDPMKMYFTQADIDEFSKSSNVLDDQVLKGDLKFAYSVFKTFLTRVDERVKLVDELLAMDHDFTVDEEMIADSELAKYPRNDAEARELWRKRIKYELLVLKADQRAKAAEAARRAEQAAAEKDAPEETAKGDEAEAAETPASTVPDEDPKARLTRRYHNFAKRMHQTDQDDLLEMYLSAFTTAFDPHTMYMAPSSLKNFEIVMSLHLEGIGAELQSEDGYTIVRNIIPGGAADKDGRLKPQDRIIGVGQAEGQLVDTMDMKLSDVVELIRGRAGTLVRLQVQPLGKTETAVYDITRAQIELKDSEARSQLLEETRNGRAFRIGVIDLPSFYVDMEASRNEQPDYKSTTRDVRRLLDDFRTKNVDVVVLDLRRNTGGSLTEAISLTGLFIDEGPIVQIKDSSGRRSQHDDFERGTSWDGPLVVLTSKFSASASEILAGAIQDYGRGLIVGDHTTHGKGTVQLLLDLGKEMLQIQNAPQLGALKITMQKFYRPSGDSTQHRGVVADVELPSLTNEVAESEADLDYSLDFDRVDAAAFQKLNLVDDSIKQQLARKSAVRREASDGFKRLLANIARYQEQKARKTVTLNEEKFLAERDEVNADLEQEREIEELNDNNRPVFDIKQFYNREAIEVTLDYLELIQLARAS